MADGIVVPLVRSVQDVELAVSACLYPPEGERGFGPRRPIRYGRIGESRVLPASQPGNRLYSANRAHRRCQRHRRNGSRAGTHSDHDWCQRFGRVNGTYGKSSTSPGRCGPPRAPGVPRPYGGRGDGQVQSAVETVVTKAHQAGVFPGIGLGGKSTVSCQSTQQLSSNPRKGY